MARLPIVILAQSRMIDVFVKPGSIRNAILGFDTNRKRWLISINAPPKKDKANKELLKFIKKETGRSWRIKIGQKSREKTLESTSS
jgi:uncharacterized protein (TIGR00251 family)